MTKINEDIWEIVDKAGNVTWFSEGVHPVVIDTVERKVNANGTPYLEFTVISDEDPDITGTARLYMSERALPYSLRTLQGILVHNAKTDIDEEKIRAYFHSLDDTDKLDLKKYHAAKAWYRVEKSGSVYIGTDNKEHDSYNRDIFSYEPKMSKRAESVVDTTFVQTESIDISEVPFD